MSHGLLRASRRVSSPKHSSVLLLHVLIQRMTSQWSADRVVVLPVDRVLAADIVGPICAFSSDLKLVTVLTTAKRHCKAVSCGCLVNMLSEEF